MINDLIVNLGMADNKQISKCELLENIDKLKGDPAFYLWYIIL